MMILTFIKTLIRIFVLFEFLFLFFLASERTELYDSCCKGGLRGPLMAELPISFEV